VPSVRELLADYQSSAYDREAADTDDLPIFLSGLCLEPYHAVEQRFTQELVNFSKKQFFEVSLHKLLMFGYCYNNNNDGL